MAWTDEPTPAQIATLTDMYEYYLNEDIAYCESIGVNGGIVQAIKDIVKNDVVRGFIIKYIPNRKIASTYIDLGEKYPGYTIHPAVKARIDAELRLLDHELDWERIKQEMRDEHDRCAMDKA